MSKTNWQKRPNSVYNIDFSRFWDQQNFGEQCFTVSRIALKLAGRKKYVCLVPLHLYSWKIGIQIGVRFRSTKTVRSFCRFSLAWNSEKSVPVQPGIRTYTVRYDYGALLYFSMLVGKPTTTVFIASSTNTNFKFYDSKSY